MKIQDVNQDIVKEIGHFELTHNQNRIKLIYNDYGESVKTLEHPRVYLFTSDDTIKKIGGSASKGGIKSTMSFYENAMSGSPGPVRFVVHNLIADELESGKIVKVYVIFSNGCDANVPGLFEQETMEVRAFKEMEDKCKFDYAIFSIKQYYEHLTQDQKNILEEYENISKIVTNIIEDTYQIAMQKREENENYDFEKFMEDVKNILSKYALFKRKNITKMLKYDEREVTEYTADDIENALSSFSIKMIQEKENIVGKFKSQSRIKTIMQTIKQTNPDFKLYPDWNFQENNDPYPNNYYQEYLRYHENRTS